MGSDRRDSAIAAAMLTEGVSELTHFHEYRCYLTPEYWLITYKDSDFIKVSRRVKHRPGFVLILMELIWDLLRGKRTALRERWAIHGPLADADAEKLILQQRAADRKVIEFWYEPKPRSGTTQVEVDEENR